MNQYSLIIGSSGSLVKIVSNNNEWIDLLRHSPFLKRYIPAVRIDCEGDAQSILTLKVGKTHFRLLSPKQAEYSNTVFDERDIVSVVEYLLEYLRSSLGLYCLHASGVVLKSKGIIFWGGASGMGKTRMALALHKNYGARFYSDEKIILDLSKKTMVGGIPYAYLSKPSLKKSYDLSDFLLFDQIHEHVPIGLLVHVYIEDSTQGFHVEKWSEEKFNWHLYEELSRKARGTSRRLFGNSVPILSIDRATTAQKRCDDVNRFTKESTCYYIRGGEDEVCKKIIELQE
jgi:hypothetical protein